MRDTAGSGQMKKLSAWNFHGVPSPWASCEANPMRTFCGAEGRDVRFGQKNGALVRTACQPRPVAEPVGLERQHRRSDDAQL